VREHGGDAARVGAERVQAELHDLVPERGRRVAFADAQQRFAHGSQKHRARGVAAGNPELLETNGGVEIAHRPLEPAEVPHPRHEASAHRLAPRVREQQPQPHAEPQRGTVDGAHRLPDVLDELARGPLRRRAEQRLDVVEVVVEGPARHAGRLDEVVDHRRVRSALGEHSERRLQDSRLGAGAPLPADARTVIDAPAHG